MSLRTQIHDAIDEITPPAPALEQTVTEYVFANPKARAALRPRIGARAWPRRLRGLTTLVAAAMLVALVSGLFVAGRIWRDLNAPPPTINQAALKTLESRPLTFVRVPPGGPCPVTPATLYPLGMGVGAGPMTLVDKEAQPSTGWGAWAVYSFAIYPYHSGVYLIRATDLQGNATIVFAKSPLGPSLIAPTGRMLGTDESAGRHVELRSEAAFQLSADASPFRYPPLFIMVGVPAGGSHCIGLQFDGPSGSETIVVDFSSYGL